MIGKRETEKGRHVSRVGKKYLAWVTNLGALSVPSVSKIFVCNILG